VANRLAGAPGGWRLEQPWRRADCANGSGVCKCASAGAGAANGETVVFIGDGRSDFCIARKCDVLFAKGALAEHADSLKQPYLPFATFDDVRRTLSVLVGELADSPRAGAKA
jgi:2-hydroxy-3-keto-5-methylthiopentenyl-1-phosphate phosphatase